LFTLHHQLEKDSILIGELALCQLRLINDANYPWCVLIPKRPNIVEVTDLSDDDYLLLQSESRRLTKAMLALFQPKKMNIASLGNMVPQLHVHHIARFETDKAWPKPVWGVEPMVDYDEKTRDKLLADLRAALAI